MKVFITGGSGFLGINLVRYLLKKNYSITAYDMADFIYPEADKIKFIKGDIRDFDNLLKASEGHEFLVHSAAALPLYSREDIFSTDVDGTRNVLKAAFQNNVNRVIHISSTAVYGVPDHHPITEEDELSGVGDYGEAKIEAEKVCLEFRNKGLCIPIIRPKSFIGFERLGVFALLFEWAADKRNFPIIGKGNNRYQYLDVEDLCDSIFLCMTLDESVVNDTFNIGAKLFDTFKNDFQAVLDHAGFGKRVIGFPPGPAIMALKLIEKLKLSPLYKWVYETAGKESFVSIEKAEKKLGFKPKFSNKDALIRNFEWFLQNRDSFANTKGVSHRAPWDNGILNILKHIF
jgi:nucleoside-diphosphate-sugar epimerase